MENSKKSTSKNSKSAGGITIKKSNMSGLYSIGWSLMVFIIMFAMAKHYMQAADLKAVMSWWFMLIIIGLVFLPTALILFNRFAANGWMFAKTIGIAVSAWFVFYLSSFKIMKFTRTNCALALIICLALNMVVFYLYNKNGRNFIKIKECLTFDRVSLMIVSEAVFFAVLVIWCYLKGFNPSAYGTEKFMDYGFITAILKSEYMPAHDLWYAGEGINYYYVGQYISAFLVRVSGVGAGYGYNLMMMTLATFGACLPFSIVYNAMIFARIERDKKKDGPDKDKQSLVPAIAGIIAAVGVSVAGNMHYPIYKWIVPKLQRMNGEAVTNYWFADATRYIGYNPDVDDKTIHEFPCYSFVLGDLHAHVINIIFVLTVIALLFAWMMNRKPVMDISKTEGAPKVNWVREIFSPQLVMVMFFIGLFHMTNYWDFPIYTVVSGAVILFTNLITYRYKKEGWILTGLQALAFIVIGFIVALPFTLSFESISTAVAFCSRHSRFYQLLVLWGLPTTLVIIFFVKKIKDGLRNEEVKAYAHGGKKLNALERIFDAVDVTDLFFLILGLSSVGLVMMPEVIYVVDIYGGAYERANTMFKLTYQAYIMFAMCMAVIITKFLYYKAEKSLRVVGIVGLILFCATACYFFEACSAWFSNYYQTLDASAFMEEENEADVAGVEWINENVPDDSVVLEMCGLSYTYFNRISVFTGNSTVLGWQTHEWLWRSSGTDKEYPEAMTERHADIIDIYTSTSVSTVQALIEKYNIDYIYVGEAEHFDGYFSKSESDSDAGYFHGGYYKKINVNDELLKSLGKVTVIAEAGTGSAYETYIVKVDHTKTFDVDTIGEVEEVVAAPDYAYANPLTAAYENYEKVDFAGNTVASEAFTYDSDGKITQVANYDAAGDLISYTQYEYSEGKPSVIRDYLADGTQFGFCECKEFSGNNVLFAHYFYGDISVDANNYEYLFTVNLSYNDDGSLAKMEFSHQDGTTNTNYALSSISQIVFSYADEGMSSMAVNLKDGSSELYTYNYDENLNPVSATVTKADGTTGVITYTF